MKRPLIVKLHAGCYQSHDADEAMGRSRAAFYSRFLVSPRSPRIMSFAVAGGAIFVTILGDQTSKRAHPPARGFATFRTVLGRRQVRRVERRPVAPERKQDPAQAPGQRDHRDAAAAARGQSIDPGA